MRFSLDVSPLDLDLTLGCGQTFRWRRQEDESWRGVLFDQVVEARAVEGRLRLNASPGGRGTREIVAEFLRTGDDVGRIQRALSSDRVLARGMAELRGLRIVKMDEWECLISYILATYANIPRIMKMIEALSERYGVRIAPDAYAFPTIDRLSKARVKDLEELGLGYRAEYVCAACEALRGDSLESFKKLPYEDLRAKLIELPGVGEKVADCVSLFGFGRLEAFPIDVWIERALSRLYRQKGTYRRLREFAVDRFGPYAGYAQEYLYFNERVRVSKGACAFSSK